MSHKPTVTPEVAATVDELMAKLTLEQKLSMVDGDLEFWDGLIGMATTGYNVTPYVAGSIPEHGIDGIRFSDGPRGVVMGHSTCFPVAMARGASFDVDLEEAIGEVIGREVRAQGGNLFAGVCVNLLRHPAWGRAQETYGDDPVHLGEMGAALTRGVQQHVMACVKHFALNSMENARFTIDVTCDEATLHEVYLPHFKRIVDEGVASVMSAYNSVNGEWCGQNRALLHDILKEQWGFDGFVMTDFLFGLRDSVTAMNAGQDLEMPVRMIHAAELRDAIASGAVSMDRLDDACRRLLAQQIRFRSVGSSDPAAYGPAIVASPAHRVLARRAAAESMVLLHNDGVLPLRNEMTRIAVFGTLADTANTGDGGSSRVRPPEVITPLVGLRERFPNVVYDDGTDLGRVGGVATSADVAIVVVGYTHADEGEYVGLSGPPEMVAKFPPRPPRSANKLRKQLETASESPDTSSSLGMGIGGDRTRLTLHDRDEALIHAIADTGIPVVVVIECGSAVLTEAWRHRANAIVISWYPGMEGGRAVADVVSGVVNPSGRLPFAIPTSEEHLPFFHAHATEIMYGPLHGQWLLDDLGVQAAFPFGYGLSYTTFEVVRAQMDAQMNSQMNPRSVRVAVRNTGERAGACVVQLYRKRSGSPTKLVGFAKVSVEPGATIEVNIECAHIVSQGDVLIVGQHANDPNSVRVEYEPTEGFA